MGRLSGEKTMFVSFPKRYENMNTPVSSFVLNRVFAVDPPPHIFGAIFAKDPKDSFPCPRIWEIMMLSGQFSLPPSTQPPPALPPLACPPKPRS